jgi:pyridoxine 4-dehydrogenase
MMLTTLIPANRLGFGAMRVIENDNIWGEPSDRQHAMKVLRRAAELSVNFFDTAESYRPHTSEILIVEALHPYQSLQRRRARH